MAGHSAAQASLSRADESHSRSAAESGEHRPGDTRGAAALSLSHSEGTRAAASDLALPPDNELWDVHAAARFLKRSVSWVYHKAEDGTLPVRRLDGWGVRFVPAELRAWVLDRGAGQGRRR